MTTDDAGGTTDFVLRPSPDDPPWLTRAWQDLGKAEVPGPGSAAWILALPGRFARWVREYYTLDSQPWCALWLSSCLHDVGIKTPANPLGARAYETWGVPRRVPGAIAVLRRTGGGHVGFLLDFDPATQRLALLSGNSHDRVSVDWFPASRLITTRWPKEFA